MASAQPKDEFRNETEGFVGVITLDPNGKERGVAVRPGASIWLSENEQILTANAPRLDEDNPFKNGHLSILTKAADVKNRRPIGDAAPDGNQQTPVEQQVAPSAPDAPVSEAPRVEGKTRTAPKPPPALGAEGNSEPKPTDAKADAKAARAKEAADRADAAKKQGEAGAVPVQDPPMEPSATGTPKPRAAATA